MKWCIMEGLGQDFMLNGLPSNRNASAISLLPSPFFGPIPPHLRNAPPLSAQYGNSQNNQNKSRGRGSKRPVSGLGGTLQVAGVPVAKFQGLLNYVHVKSCFDTKCLVHPSEYVFNLWDRLFQSRLA
jgi:hypothetical protein